MPRRTQRRRRQQEEEGEAGSSLAPESAYELGDCTEPYLLLQGVT